MSFRQIFLGSIIGCSIASSILSTFLEIHWIHLYTLFLVGYIFYHILEWKYDWVEEGEQENGTDRNKT